MLNNTGDLYSAIAIQAQHRPDRPCLVDATKQLTYSEALSLIDAVAANLLSLGVSSSHCVAIYSQKSITAVLYFLALSKLGCDVVTLDLAFPEQQCHYVLADAHVDYIVCETKFPHSTDLPVYVAETLLEPSRFDSNYHKTQSSKWIVYSSGTTGNPKGIWISEQSMLNSFIKRDTFSSYTEDDVVACSIYFYWEVFRPLIHGASIVILENESLLDFDIYSQYLNQYCVTETLWTPSFAELLAKTATYRQIGQLASLQRVWLNGEVVSEHLYQLLHTKLATVRFFNLYSISETFDVSAFELDGSQLLSQSTATIGKPLPNTDMLLLKPDYSECLPGEQGELFIGGNSLAGGYLNQPDKEAESFVQLPQYPASPYWFKTKDVAYQSKDGGYHIIGRNDDIVKLRGYNVSLLSIESVIKKAIPLRQCYVKLEAIGDGDEKHIVAYLQPDNVEQFIDNYDYDQDSCHSPKLYDMLCQALPHYAMPSSCKIIDNIQFNAYSAKLVRKQITSNEVEPIKALWQQCLNLPSQAITDDADFFALGGTSLQAVQLIQLFNERFDHTINIQILYQNSRFQAFKEVLNGIDKSDAVNPLIYEDINWKPSSPSTTIRMRHILNANSIFITGSTGYIGAHWLHHLLQQTTACFYCLVRCQSQEEGRKRLEKIFAYYALPIDSWSDRISIISGDLKNPHFGLDKSRWQSLSTKIDLIIHAAAQVNLMHEYSNLRASTILGTQSVLELATTDHIKPLFLISSDAVFNDDNIGSKRDAFLPINSINQLTYGYAQTKWVQEHLLKLLSEQYQIPYIVVRLGNVAPSLTSKKSNPNDANGMILKAIKVLKRQPKNLVLEFCPINRLVVVLTNLAKTFDNRIVSLNGINTVSSTLLKQILPDWQVEDIDYQDWQDALSQTFPELYGLTSIPQLFTRQHQPVADLTSSAPYTQELHLDNIELRNSLLAMVEQD